MTFWEFNKLVNPKDEPMYFGTVYNAEPKLVNGSSIQTLGKETSLEISWVIQPGFLVIETNQTNILPYITSKAESVMVFQKNADKLIIVSRSDFNRTTTFNRLYCGITANTIGPGKTLLLPFKSKVNTSSNLTTYNHTLGNTIGELPLWLKPIRKISNNVDDGIQIPVIGNPQVVLLDCISRLKALGLNKILTNDIVTLINNEFCQSPLKELDLENVLQISEQQMMSQFFEKDKFLHDKLGNYIIRNCYVKKDIISKELYFYNEKKKAYSTDTDYLMGYMTKLIPSLKHYQKEETLKYIQSFLYEDAVKFNENPYTIVFKNGILDVNTLVFKPMSPDYHESIQINANYNPNAQSQIVDEYFKTATKGNQDIESLLFEAIGYSMIKTNELQKAFLLVGSGRNGKSTYLDLIRELLGRENCTAISFKDLANTFRASAMNNKLASLAGDISAAPLTDSDMVKSIISGEEVMIEQKYKDAQAKSLFTTLFFAANKLPRTPDQSFGFYRRLTIIPFVADLTAVSRVDGLLFKQKLLSQEALDYTAYRAILAISRLLNTTKEFTTPKEVIDMMEQYKIENSSVLSWYADEFKNKREELIKFKTREAAYNNYKAWCTNSLRHALNMSNFVNAVKTELNLDLI